MYDEERVRGRKMQIEEKVEERSEMIFFFKGEEGTMQCLHLGQLVGREHLGIGKEKLKLGSRFHFHQPIFLQFMEKLESCEEVVLVQQEVYHTVAEMVLGAVVVVRHSYYHDACRCCGVLFRHRRRLLPLSLLSLSQRLASWFPIEKGATNISLPVKAPFTLESPPNESPAQLH